MKRIILICLCFVFLFIISSCKSTEEADLPKETAPETENLELDKEIAENYTNEVISYEDFYSFYEDYPSREIGQGYTVKLNPTYYEIVKSVGSTGVNTSDEMYRYEWALDDGRYLYALFFETEYKAGQIPPDSEASRIVVLKYSMNDNKIKNSYGTYAEYLFDTFYEKRFDTYANFVSWFGYRNIPEPEEKFVRNSNQANIDRIWRECFDVPVDKIKALNVKAGMSLDDVRVWLNSTGNSSSSMNQWWWKVDEDFYLKVDIGYVLGEGNTVKDTVIISVRYDSKKTLGEGDDFFLQDFFWM